MTNEEIIELRVTDSDTAKVRELVLRNHKQGLDVDRAAELGLFQRISFLTCAVTTLYTTGYRLISNISNLFELAGANRHEVKRELKAMFDAYERFSKFFRGYQTSEGKQEMGEEVSQFYHQYLRWCNLPEEWALGDKQMTDPETDPLILIDKVDKELRFYRSILEAEDLSEEKIEYCVTKYNPATSTQETVENKGLDKSTVGMVAKRYSANDPDGIYTASKLVTKEKRITEIYPLKAYENGELVGSYRKTFKQQ